MKNAELIKTIANINKKYGDGTVVLGSDIIEQPPRFTSGSLALDVSLGGGWPANQWHELIGEASNGKTAIALKTVAANQKANPDFTTVWVAAEQWVDSYATMCGVDTSRVYVVSTNIMEEAYEAVIQLTESRAVECIVVD
jgi:recombination protein RecA